MSITASIKPSTQPRPVTLQWDDFSGGLIADANEYPLMSNINGLLDVLNYEYVLINGKIKLKSRMGHGLVATGPSGIIYDIFNYTGSNGNTYTCFSCGDDLNKVNGSSYVKIEDLAGSRARMCQLNGQLIIADNGLHSWDGHLYTFENDTAIPLIETAGYYGTGGYVCYSAFPRGGNYFVLPTWGESSDTIAVPSIDVVLSKTGSPTGNANIIIYDSAGSAISNGTSANYDVSTLTTSAAACSFTFSTSPVLAPGQTYYIVVVYTGGDAANFINIWKTNRKYFPASFMCAIQYASATWTPTLTEEVAMDINGGPHPLATFVINKKSRIYCNDTVYPNRLYYSNNNDTDDYSTIGGGGFIEFDGIYEIRAAKVYNDEIYVFGNSPQIIYKITGDTPEEYVTTVVKEGITAYSQDVVMEAGDDLFFVDFLCHIYSLKKIIASDDLKLSNISNGRVYKTYLYSKGGSIRLGVNHANSQLIVIYGSGTGYYLFYDLVHEIWGRHKINLPTNNGVTSIGPGNNSYAFLMGTNANQIISGDVSFTSDANGYFDLEAKVPWTDLGTLQEKDARFGDCILISDNQETYDLEIYTDMNDTTVKKTLSMISLSRNGAYETPGCGHLNEVNLNFKQIMAQVANVSSSTGPHYLDRIVIETNILSRY